MKNSNSKALEPAAPVTAIAPTPQPLTRDQVNLIQLFVMLVHRHFIPHPEERE